MIEAQQPMPHKRSIFAILAAAGLAYSQDGQYRPKNQLIPGPACLTMKGIGEGSFAPCTEADHQRWLADVQHWRAERKIRIGYDSSRYDRPEMKWIQSSFMQPQMMVHDRYFYDPAAGKYTVDRYLDDLEQRYLSLIHI